jgi:hypothetical protein
VTAYGAIADAKINKSGSIGAMSSMLTLGSPGNTPFSPADVGKPISINGAGVGTGTTPTNAVGTGGGMSCGMGVSVYYQVTFISENTNNKLLTSEGRPSSETPVAFNPGGCLGSNGEFTVTGPTIGAAPTGSTGWLPYVSYSSGAELQQSLSGCALTTQGNGCAFGSNWSSGTGNLLFDTTQPPQDTVLLTTIASYGSTSTVMLTDAAVTNINNGGNVAWGTDNYIALTAALNACVEAADITVSNFGCTVFFPPPTGTTAPSGLITGKYFISKGLVVTQNAATLGIQNLTLRGGGSYGSGDTASWAPMNSNSGSPAGSAEIVGSGRFPLLTVGQAGQMGLVDGFSIINLGFRDMALFNPGNGSGAASRLGNTWGGVRLIDVIHPYIERVNAANFGVGYGIELEGDPSTSGQTQVGAVVDSNCTLCRIGIWAPQSVSDIQVRGGTYSGSSGSPSYGADFETVTGGSTTGSIRVTGTAFRNDTTAALRFFDCQGCQTVEIKGEQVSASPAVGTGIVLDGTTKCLGDVVVGGGFAHFVTDVSAAAACSQPLILASPLTNVSDSASSPLELSLNGLMLGGATAGSPTVGGQFSYNTTNNQFVGGLGSSTGVFPTFTGSNPSAGDCVKWASGGQVADAVNGATGIGCNNAMMLFWCNGIFASSITDALVPAGSNGSCTNSTAAAGFPMPFSGTLKNLQVVAGTAGHTGTSGVVTVFVGGSGSTITCMVGTGTSCSDPAHSVQVSAGQTVYVQATTPSMAGETLANLRVSLQLQ